MEPIMQLVNAMTAMTAAMQKLTEKMTSEYWTIVKKVDRELEGVKSFSRIGQAIKGY